MPKFYIHVLRDPRDSIPIYVGKGKGRRAYAHLNGGTHNPMLERVRKKCVALGLFFKPEIIARLDDEAEAFAKEKEKIAWYGRRDLKRGLLTNLTDGGEGTSGAIVSLERRLKIGATHRGKILSVETLGKISVSLKAAFAKPGMKAKKSATSKAVWAIPGMKGRQSAAAKAMRAIPGTKEKQSAAAKAKWADPVYRERQSAAPKAKWGADMKAKCSARSKAMWADPVYREKWETKRIAAAKATWANRMTALGF
jgi:hypothetical protein